MGDGPVATSFPFILRLFEANAAAAPPTCPAAAAATRR